MKTYTLPKLILQFMSSLAVLALSLPVSAFTWDITTVNSTSARYTCPVSIGLDSDNNPQIAYIHFMYWTNYFIQYDYFDGSSFTESTMNSQELLFVGYDPALAMPPGRTKPLIAYYDTIDKNLQLVHYGPLSGSGEGSWIKTAIDTEGDVGINPSIAVTSSPVIHISYWDYDNDSLKYTYYDGVSWSIEVIDTTGGSKSAVVLDSMGSPHIVYRSHDESTPAIKHAWIEGNSWEKEIIESGPAGTTIGSSLSLAIDSSDRLHVSYNYGYEITSAYDLKSILKYACYGNSSWDIQTVDDSGTSTVTVGKYNDIAADTTGTPHIAYFDDDPEILKYARYSGGTWNSETPVDMDTIFKGCCSIAVGSDDLPHIAFLTEDRVSWKQKLIYAKAGTDNNTSTTSTTVGSTTTTTASVTTTTIAKCPCKKFYGEDSEKVELLRYLRDNVLNQTPEGRELIKLYYQWSPAVVKTMEEDEEFKHEVKEMIDGVLELIEETE